MFMLKNWVKRFFVSVNSKDEDNDDYLQNTTDESKNTLDDGISTGSDSELSENLDTSDIEEFLVLVEKESKESSPEEDKIKKRNTLNQFLLDMKFLEFLLKEKNSLVASLLGVMTGVLFMTFFSLFFVLSLEEVNINSFKNKKIFINIFLFLFLLIS
jgi:hypothetical protein|uniref:Uncharacterized protein n=1 Tax=Synura petersenii TaxID=52555 RepID=A0A3G2QYG3_9STRA|nr:hypothetical protein [Synura petersenii]AYO28179.1 hypothetical protein [Synura petersenii]